MPDKQTNERAKKAKRRGKSASTQAGEFVREEIHHIRQGKHGARSTKQAIAIGLSKARRTGVDLPPPKKGTTSEKTRRSAARSYELGRKGKRPSARRSRARLQLSNASHDARLQRKRLPSRRAQQHSGGSGALHLRVPARVLLAGVNEPKNARGTGSVFDKPATMTFFYRDVGSPLLRCAFADEGSASCPSVAVSVPIDNAQLAVVLVGVQRSPCKAEII